VALTKVIESAIPAAGQPVASVPPEVDMWYRTCRMLVATVLTLTAAVPARAEDPAAPARRSGLVGLTEGEALRLTLSNRACRWDVRRGRRGCAQDPPDGTFQSFDRSDLTRIEVARRNDRLRGAAHGALVGAAALPSRRQSPSDDL
jgi:hypothetical protein